MAPHRRLRRPLTRPTEAWSLPDLAPVVAVEDPGTVRRVEVPHTTHELEQTPLRPRRYHAAALLGLAVAIAVLGRDGVNAWGLIASGAAAILVWVAAIDLEVRRLPDRIVLPTSGAVLVADAVLNGTISHAAAAFVASGLMLVAVLVRPADLGMGDVKLVFLLGALLGSQVVSALAFGFALLATTALLLVLGQGRGALRRQLPLGPFLAAGAILTLLATHG